MPDLDQLLRPQQQLATQAACGVTGESMTSWKVSARTGSDLGYLVVAAPDRADGTAYPVTHVSPNRLEPSQPG